MAYIIADFVTMIFSFLTTGEISSTKQNAKKYHVFPCLKRPMLAVYLYLRQSDIIPAAQVFCLNKF